MFKIVLEIDGMACGMCETHVIEATGYQVLKVTQEPYEKKELGKKVIAFLHNKR